MDRIQPAKPIQNKIVDPEATVENRDFTHDPVLSESPVFDSRRDCARVLGYSCRIPTGVVRVSGRFITREAKHDQHFIVRD